MPCVVNPPESTAAPGRSLSPWLVVGWVGVVLVLLLTVLDHGPVGLTVVGLLTGLLFTRDPSVASALRVTRDWLGMLLFLAFYGNSFAVADTMGMPVQERSVIAIDEFLGFGESWVHRTQRLINWNADPAWWEVLFPLFYASHFLVSFATLATLYVSNRSRWKQYMIRWVTLSFVGLVGYVTMPTVPPWMASENGTVAFVHEGNPRGWSVVDGQAISELFTFGRDALNPIAAMPSLHAAYPMLLLVLFWPTRGYVMRAVLVVYCAFMALTLVITGQHWLIDVFAGWACAIAVHTFFNWREASKQGETVPSSQLIRPAARAASSAAVT